MQIMIHEIRHFTLMTELLTFTIYIAFFASIFGGTLVYHGVPQKYLEERCSPALRLDYTTCDGCYFHIHKLQYLCNSNVTFFKSFEQTFEVISQ